MRCGIHLHLCIYVLFFVNFRMIASTSTKGNCLYNRITCFDKAFPLFSTFLIHSFVYNITLLYILFLLYMFLLCSYFIFFHMFVFFTCIFVVFNHILSHATNLVQLVIYLVAVFDCSHLLAKYVHQKVDNG